MFEKLYMRVLFCRQSEKLKYRAHGPVKNLKGYSGIFEEGFCKVFDNSILATGNVGAVPALRKRSSSEWLQGSWAVHGCRLSM